MNPQEEKPKPKGLEAIAASKSPQEAKPGDLREGTVPQGDVEVLRKKLIRDDLQHRKDDKVLQVEIVSDGDPFEGTTVKADGKPLMGVTHVDWSIDVGAIALLKLEVNQQDFHLLYSGKINVIPDPNDLARAMFQVLPLWLRENGLASVEHMAEIEDKVKDVQQSDIFKLVAQVEEAREMEEGHDYDPGTEVVPLDPLQVEEEVTE